jgi:hypothetical protein
MNEMCHHRVDELRARNRSPVPCSPLQSATLMPTAKTFLC